MATAIPGTVPSSTLRALIRGHPVPLAHAAVVAQAILDCLDAMLAQGGFPYRLAPEDIQIEGDERHPLVRAVVRSEAAGPADYVSPEVAAGFVPDRRSVIWQAGALLFELVSGSPPWSEPQTREEGVTIPSLNEARPDIPDTLACIIYRMLDPDPDLRLQSLAEARVALSAVLEAAEASSVATAWSLRSGKERPAPLPASPTWVAPFIGRVGEMAEIRRILTATSCRVLTLLGPGGVGKSRLAFHAAQDLSSDFADGVYIVPLGAVLSPAFVTMAIAGALDVSFHGNRAPAEQLAEALRGKHMLVVLDDFDRLVEGADLIARILRTAEGPRFLVTSRTRLNLTEEALLQLEGLSVPHDPHDPDPGRYDAIRLFLEHARRLGARALLAEDDLPEVVHVCRMLDGLPLGIEQAATWVRTLSCGAISQEIARDLGFLSTTSRDVSPQHRSMRAVFERSWRLLDDAQRGTLARLSVFSGGFRRDAAAAVAGLDLALLSQLIDRSLIQRSGPQRYRMHNLLRSFLQEKLAELGVDPNTTLTAHAAWYAHFLEAQERRIRGGDPETLAQVDAESDNIHAAWDWAVEEAQTPILQRLVEPLCSFLSLRAWYTVGERICADAARRFAALQYSEDHARLRARLLARQGAFLFRLGERSSTRALLEESRRIQTGIGARRDLAFTLRHLALVAISQGDHLEALALDHEALALCREFADPGMEAYVVGDMGIAAREAGDYDAARDLFARSLALHRSEGTVTGVIGSLNCLGTVCRSRGDDVGARAFFEESRRESRRVGNRRGEMVAAMNLCNLALDRGEPADALGLATDALATARDLNHQDMTAMCLCTLGNACLEIGQTDQARRSLEESLAIRTALGAYREAAVSRACLADALCLSGELDRACLFYEESLRVFEKDDNRWGIVSCLRGLCDAYLSRGDLPRASNAGRRALAVLRGTGDRPHALQVMESWVHLLVARGDHRRTAELWGCLTAHVPASRLSRISEDIQRRIEAILLAPETHEAMERGRFRSPEELIEELADESEDV